MGCLGYSWYLSLDMLYFLMVGPICIYFIKMQQRQTTGIRRYIELYLPCIILIIIQLISTSYIFENYNVIGGFDNEFNDRVYVMPYTRVTPYAVGIFLCLFHAERKRLSTELGMTNYWRILTSSNTKNFILFLLSLSIMLFIFFIDYLQFRCEDDEHDCEIWYGLAIYGQLSMNNWSNDGKGYINTLYYTFQYLIWSIGLSYVCYYLFAGYGKSLNYLLSHSFW